MDPCAGQQFFIQFSSLIHRSSDELSHYESIDWELSYLEMQRTDRLWQVCEDMAIYVGIDQSKVELPCLHILLACTMYG